MLANRQLLNRFSTIDKTVVWAFSRAHTQLCDANVFIAHCFLERKPNPQAP